MTPNLLDQRLQFRRQSFVVREVLREGVLGADGLSDPVGADRSIVDAERDPVEKVPALPKLAVMNSSVWLRISMPVKIPRPFIFALVAGPIPWNLPTGRS